ncbi:MAG: hypothetical protein IJC33_02110 [Clostridia bacterium]|nr:hypothetical protein [Clostridia bacterium]
MPLYFIKPKRWPPSRPVQFILAFLVLLVVLAVLGAWLFIGYRQSIGPDQSDGSDTSLPVSAEPLAGTANSLLIINEAGHEQFVLIQANPAAGRITVAPVPASLGAADGSTLADILRKHGSARAKETVAAALELPVKHYITLSAAAAETYFGYLENGLTLMLAEDVSYTDQNGAKVKISAGERSLAPGQAAALLRYTHWQNPNNAATVAADLTAAVLNQHLLPDRSLSGHFAALSNAAQTDLRIDHFNSYRSTLVYLAEQNDGTLCRRVTLSGTTADGLFTPDLTAIRTQTGLYAE